MTRSKAVPYLLGLTLLVVFSEALRVGWFHSNRGLGHHEPALVLTLPPLDEPGFERLDLAGTRGGQILSYDHGDLVRLFDEGAEEWSMDLYYLEYEAGNAHQLNDLFGHSPEVCLRASGAELEQSFPDLEAPIDGQPVIARHLAFRHSLSGDRFHVFKLVWIARGEDLGIRGTETDFRRLRLKAALQRYSRPRARLILASVSGAQSPEQARSLFLREVVERCRFETRQISSCRASGGRGKNNSRASDETGSVAGRF